MEVLTILYTLSGFMVGAAFIPQITTLLSDNTGAAAMSLLALAALSLCTTIGLVYVCINTDDFFIIFDHSLCTLGEVTVLVLAIKRRIEKNGFLLRRTAQRVFEI